MTSIILRRSSSVCSGRSLSAAVTSIETFLRRSPIATDGAFAQRAGAADVGQSASFSTVVGAAGRSSYGFGKVRDFHVKSGPLGFKATFAAQAEYAVAYDEERGGSDEGLEIAKLGIAKEIVESLSQRGIVKLFPIQRAVLEPAMQGRDMIGRAKTGTGKTLAFGIPIMDKIIQFNAKHGRGRNPLALIMAPTRELARQVEKEFYESAPSLDTICVYGGTPIGQQMRKLDYGVDVVVGTPGRIIDLLKRGALNLSEVQFVVLDEADQMLAVGFEEDVEVILSKLPQKRHSMMFSATMPTSIRNITKKYLNNPLTVDLVGEDDQKLAEGISLYSVASDMYSKAGIIGPLVTEHGKGGKCIVFVQTKRDADRLAYALSNSIGCEALHGDISQNQRERTLSRFREGQFNVLVATDVAARGLDIPNVDLVIHYELPNSSEIFVHRSGRTGRAGKKGSVILIHTNEQSRTVRGIEREVGCRFTQLPGVAAEAGSAERYNSMGGGSRFGSRDGGFGRFGGQGGSRFGRSGGFGGPSSGRFGSYGGSGSGESGGFRFGGSRSGNFGGPGSNRSGGFGDFGSNRSGGFGDFGSSRPGGFGDFGSSRSGGFGDGASRRRPSGFGSQSSGFGGAGRNSQSSLFGSFGDEK